MGYLHANALVHADVKPENATVSDGLVKLIDLSLAQPPGRWRRVPRRHPRDTCLRSRQDGSS